MGADRVGRPGDPVDRRFADIFRSNSLKNGVLPIVVDPATHDRLLRRSSRTIRTPS